VAQFDFHPNYIVILTLSEPKGKDLLFAGNGTLGLPLFPN
jgi:hypothetical protein